MEYTNRYLKVSTTPEDYLQIQQLTGGVVMCVQKGQQLLLIKIKRIDGQSHWEFPRGFKEKNETGIQAALRELNEELGLNDQPIRQIDSLGQLQTDSGLIKDNVSAVYVEVAEQKSFNLEDDEGIFDSQWVTRADLDQLITTDQITDNFTLATLMKYYARMRS